MTYKKYKLNVTFSTEIISNELKLDNNFTSLKNLGIVLNSFLIGLEIKESKYISNQGLYCCKDCDFIFEHIDSRNLGWCEKCNSWKYLNKKVIQNEK